MTIESSRDQSVPTPDRGHTAPEPLAVGASALAPKAGRRGAAKEPGPAPDASSQKGGGPVYPRSVTPGIETHPDDSGTPPPGVYVGLDWMRFTGPDDLRDELESTLVSMFGATSEACGGAMYFRHGRHWSPGVLLSWGHGSNIFQVDIQGSRLRLMGGDDRMNLLCRLMKMGMKPTRLDGALDFIDQGFEVCENAEASCRRGEHCLLRKWSPNNEYEANGAPTRILLKLGARGSAVCGRFYDKGLEQGAATIGKWERLEVEWKSDRATAVAEQLRRAVCDGDWPPRLASLVFGALDFREKNGRSELARRPRVAWWVRVLGGHGAVAVAPARTPRSFERWHAGFVQSYGRVLMEMANAIGESVSDVTAWLLMGATPSIKGGPVVAEFAKLCSETRRVSKT